METIPGAIGSWITVKGSKSVGHLLESQVSETPVEVEVVEPERLNGRNTLVFNMKGGISGKWEGGKSDEPSMLHFAIETTEDQTLYRLYYLTNRLDESAGIVHVAERDGSTPDDYIEAREELQRLMRRGDTVEKTWDPLIIQIPT